MKNVIYIDVLVCVNLFINYFLLLGTGLFLHRQARRLRLLASAALGGASSLLILCPTLHFLPLLAVKLGLACLLVWAAFGVAGRAVYIKAVLTFFGVNFLFAGVMLAIWLFAPMLGMHFGNGVVYFSLSPLALVASTMVAYGVIWLLRRLLDNRVRKDSLLSAAASVDGQEVWLNCLLDTGNRLTDPLGGIPAVVCRYDAVEPLIPASLRLFFSGGEGGTVPEHQGWKTRIRMIPYHTVGSKGVLPAFVPDRFAIQEGETARGVDVVLAVTADALSQGEYDAIIGEQV